jgi:FkbM family methyltransferase
MIGKIKSKIRRIFLQLSGKVNHINKGINCNHVWYGNRYGGFYICPEFLNENSIIYSFGIGEDISFDITIFENHDCHVYGFDPTPKSIKWITNQHLPEKFIFFDFGIGNNTGFVEFFLPKNPEYVSGSYIIHKNVSPEDKIIVKMKSFEDIINELGHKQIDVLKMDIEGAEYDVIENILNSKIPINQILIEFHERLFENGKIKTQKVIEILKNNGYEIFGVSDSFDEISFIRKSIFYNN